MIFENILTPVLDFINATPGALQTLQTLIGAATASFIIWLVRRLRDLRAERKYSLAGEYKGYYEDLVDGKTIMQKDIMTLKQRGMKITAGVCTAGNNRGWTFKGEIDPIIGYIYGFYRADDPLDTAVGTFIFDRKDNGNLSGIWAGYDSQNKNMQQGRYEFSKMLSIKVRKAQKSDIGKILQIAAKELGEGYLDYHHVDLSSPNMFIYVAVHEKEIIGFSMAQIIEKDSFSTYLKGHEYRMPPYLKKADNDGTIGFLRSIAVDSNYQHQGIGMKLVKSCLSKLKKAKTEHIFSIAWTTDTAHIGPLLEAKSFKHHKRFENFWTKESKDLGYDCPNCGHPCECAALLYIQ